MILLNPYFTLQRLSTLRIHSLKKAKEAALNNYEATSKNNKHFVNLARHKLGERMAQIASAEKHNPLSGKLTR